MAQRPENYVELYDVSPRDGDQACGVNLSTDDKIWFAREDDRLGIDAVEGGFPASNDTDALVFSTLAQEPLPRTQLAAFGMTRRKRTGVEHDAGIAALAAAGTPIITLVGKSSRFHVTHALGTSVEENCAMIRESIEHLRALHKQVFYDAEHFFDAMREDSEHALRTLEAAWQAGASRLVLCDTNGGHVPESIGRTVEHVRAAFRDAVIGIHTHNDRGLAVANMRAAVQAGARHVQGTWNGFGERAGNMDLSQAVPNLVLDGYRTGMEDRLPEITPHAHAVDRRIRQRHRPEQPFVGERAFAHKGGMHASAVACNAAAYEFMPPERVGNCRRILGSKQSGLSNVRSIVEQAALLDDATRTQVLADKNLQMRILGKIKHLESIGYSLDNAPATLELTILRALDLFHPAIAEVTPPHIDDDVGGITRAIVHVRINGSGNTYLEVAQGGGPLGALEKALKKALVRTFPNVESMQLEEYRSDVPPGIDPTMSAIIQVRMGFGDGTHRWCTTGANEDSTKAGWDALLDAIEYKILLDAHLPDHATNH